MAAQARILVIEDEWLIAADIGHRIQVLGHRVIGPARSLSAAFEVLRDQQFDAALLDVSLGDQSSYPIADALAKHGTPFCFITSLALSQLPERFRRCMHLQKPFGGPALDERIKALVPEAGQTGAISAGSAEPSAETTIIPTDVAAEPPKE